MGSPVRALLNGLRIAARRWQVLLALYLGTLLPALALAAWPGSLLWGLARRTVIGDIAAGFPTWLGFDALGMLARAGLAGSELPQGVLAGLGSLTWAALLLPLAGGVISAFLYGGLLSIFRAPADPFRWRVFFGGCWHWLGCYLLLGLGQAVLFILGLVVLGALAVWAVVRLGGWGAALALPILLAALAGWVVFFEVTRVKAVVTTTRNPFRAAGFGARFLARHPGQILLFYALAFLALAALHGLYRWGILPLVPTTAVLPALAVQQSFILLRLLARAARLAGLAGDDLV